MWFLTQAETALTWISVPGDAADPRSGETGCGKAARWSACSLPGSGWRRTSQWWVRQRREVSGRSGFWRRPLPPPSCRNGWRPRRGTCLHTGKTELLLHVLTLRSCRIIISNVASVQYFFEKVRKSITCRTCWRINKYPRVNDASIAREHVLHVLLGHGLGKATYVQVGIFYCVWTGPCMWNLATGVNKQL